MRCRPESGLRITGARALRLEAARHGVSMRCPDNVMREMPVPEGASRSVRWPYCPAIKRCENGAGKSAIAMLTGDDSNGSVSVFEVLVSAGAEAGGAGPQRWSCRSQFGRLRAQLRTRTLCSRKCTTFAAELPFPPQTASIWRPVAALNGSRLRYVALRGATSHPWPRVGIYPHNPLFLSVVARIWA
jgi:hypothetical protein